MDAIFWDDSGGDTFCQRCGGCGYIDVLLFCKCPFVVSVGASFMCGHHAVSCERQLLVCHESVSHTQPI